MQFSSRRPFHEGTQHNPTNPILAGIRDAYTFGQKHPVLLMNTLDVDRELRLLNHPWLQRHHKPEQVEHARRVLAHMQGAHG